MVMAPEGGIAFRGCCPRAPNRITCLKNVLKITLVLSNLLKSTITAIKIFLKTFSRHVLLKLAQVLIKQFPILLMQGLPQKGASGQLRSVVTSCCHFPSLTTTTTTTTTPPPLPPLLSLLPLCAVRCAHIYDIRLCLDRYLLGLLLEL